MIGRGYSRATWVVTSVLFLSLGIGNLSHPTAAFAATERAAKAAANAISHIVTFTSNGATTQHVTTAKTVGDFLKERGLVVTEADYVSPSLASELADNTAITFRAAVPVTIVTSSGSKTVSSSAIDVGTLLENENIDIGSHDEVSAPFSDGLVAGERIKIVRVAQWTKSTKQPIAPRTITRLVFSLPPGTTRIISHGRRGERETIVGFTERDGVMRHRVIATRIVRKPRERVIARGIGEYAAFEQLAKFGLQKTSYIAASAISMMATAYTAECAGCSGYTAIGPRAGHGIVAVDPRVIPLGTRLYIPGYGIAIAGDTGGAIVGNRIDLGFNSLSDAMQFGRRPVTVYRLR
ncbi:MAG: DUF348 domain-containing protein [Candidatus Eremiobacteraeota bacterium]|nr:DUF348 domain-containing protein [Candidatus Eremiobacteraeota bacterium]MBV9737170.1 DUF348 domain-containing protein [Candidatus Eremiobacteraeota bacterium]